MIMGDVGALPQALQGNPVPLTFLFASRRFKALFRCEEIAVILGLFRFGAHIGEVHHIGHRARIFGRLLQRADDIGIAAFRDVDAQLAPLEAVRAVGGIFNAAAGPGQRHASGYAVPVSEVCRPVNAALCAHPQVQDEADLKTRFIVADSFEIGIAPANRAFVHAQLRLLAGRTPEAKKELSDLIAAVLRERTPRPQGVLVQLSVEIVDMDRPSYVKERL